ncbi:glycerol-3-phosphate dehydrogenase C-terminal domain-containing protein [Chitinimonas koreensis]|uniref:glycerol-3-phosphate dehydrogenase C-terminal domain-containing protein n=1 Tax=Chitinimonas koreensis TaxID=356302 RepID=UPI0027E3E8F7|nr:glycerol-3-phosphate dehydrogenase C-terminal domain-containing protein [Chitinimonas koreensis]
MPGNDAEAFAAGLCQSWPWLPPALARRYARTYGSRAGRLIGEAGALADLGAEIAPGVYEAELRYLVREEFVRRADDVLWRRSKLGLHLPADAATRIAAWLQDNVAKLTETNENDYPVMQA